MDQQVVPIIDLLKELQSDQGVPRNVKSRLQEMQSSLEADGDLSLKANKILSDVEDIANDINLPMFVRTQIWNLTSMLESLHV